MILGIISDSHHYYDAEGKLYNLSVLKAQFECWAQLFDQVVICAPLRSGLPPVTHSAYSAPNIELLPIASAGGDTVRAKLDLAWKAKSWWGILHRLLERVDAVHIRCPNNISILGLLALRRSRCLRHAIYTGCWTGSPSEPATYRWQRWFLRTQFRGPVAVYGEWPGQPGHIVPFFSPSFSDHDWEAVARVVDAKIDSVSALERLPVPVQLVCVGHLDTNKNHAMVLNSVARLKAAGVPCELRCLGDGPERPALERQSRELGIADAVHFPGYVSHQTVAQCLQRAHFSILASGTEGFPKVLGEAMLQGAVPLASDIGLNAQIVGCGSRGLTFPYNDAAALAAIIERLVREPQRVATMMREGFDYSKTLTFESFRDQIRSTLERHWKVEWSHPSPLGN